ncbi:BolA family protein [Echinimonas agarilytica]|uniref:DNA-binding transcriptional regulator BolA n=1 Tax=Echinimonas agarilytica TaxID=1215918 RepID=A0AA42B7T7_9GAMM|nr:BolA/IbaG family iron-sulfur metabolism protein [Echinimonas agarilytica]MCM2680560.1 BolA/IbaG family iron-sulfur metabolism protein [Echinimonas agarilytica]
MSTQLTIERKILAHFQPEHVEVINESGAHNVPPGSESHFKVVIVSARFEGLRLIQRHREVNGLLAEELQNGVHALAMHTYTADEWRSQFADVPKSPDCMGGSKG